MLAAGIISGGDGPFRGKPAHPAEIQCTRSRLRDKTTVSASASDLIYSGRLVTAEEATTLQLVHGVADKAEIEKLAWDQLMSLIDIAPEAFAESKHMRSGRFCADLRSQLSARVARQVAIWRRNPPHDSRSRRL